MKKNLKTENGNLKNVLIDINQIVIDAMNSYLRTSLNGGMPKELADGIINAVEDAARLQYFDYFVADKFTKLKQKG